MYHILILHTVYMIQLQDYTITVVTCNYVTVCVTYYCDSSHETTLYTAICTVASTNSFETALHHCKIFPTVHRYQYLTRFLCSINAQTMGKLVRIKS